MDVLNNLSGWIRYGRTRCGAPLWVPGEEGCPMPLPMGGPAPEMLYFNDSHGGLHRVLPCLRTRIAALCARGGEWIALSGGDDHGGGATSDLSVTDGGGYSAAWNSMVKAGVDLSVPGNHDLDWGWDTYFDLCRRSQPLPRVLSHYHGALPAGTAHFPVLLVAFRHHLMAFLGALCMDQTREAWRHLVDPAEAIPQWIAWLRDRVDSVVVLSHLGRESRGEWADRDLLEHITPQMCILGAHTHDLIPPEGSVMTGQYLQSGQKGNYLGHAHGDPAGSGWQVYNEACSEPPDAPSDPLQSRHPVRLTFPESSPDTRPSVDGYTGEIPAINAATDILHEDHGCGPETLVALCVRFFSQRIPHGCCSREDWYRIFPYADCLATFRFPRSRLGALLQANAQRFLLPAHYLEERGLLHFSGNLTYQVTRRRQGVTASSIRWNEQWLNHGKARSADDKVSLLTQGYVAEGMGGYDAVFREAGLDWSRGAVTYVGGSVRDLLWDAWAARTPAQRAAYFRKDGRLLLHHGDSG